MKILFLHMTMGLTQRGSEISSDVLATGLAKKHQVLVLQSGPVTQKPYRLKRVFPLAVPPKPAPTTIIEKLRMRLYLDHGSQQVRRFTQACLPYIQKFAPDIIIATNGAPQLQILRTLSVKAKLVVFGRAGIGYHDLDNLRFHPDLFVALTPQAKAWACAIDPAINVVYIPNPLIASRAKKMNLQLPHPIVLTVGALSKYKNSDQVIRAAAGLQTSLVIIGDGEESKLIGEQLSHFPGEFRWIRHVDHRDLQSYYQAADIFCFIPDPQEAFGRVYLEAMHAGLPIVASDDLIRRNIVGTKGNFVDPHSIKAIQAGLNAAHLQGRQNYREELKKYALTTVISQLEKEFHDLLS